MSCRTSLHVLAGERKSDTKNMVIKHTNYTTYIKYMVRKPEGFETRAVEHKVE